MEPLEKTLDRLRLGTALFPLDRRLPPSKDSRSTDKKLGLLDDVESLLIGAEPRRAPPTLPRGDIEIIDP
jgi:hypothetical protein